MRSTRSLSLSRFLTVLFLSGASVLLEAQTASLLVLSKHDHTLAIVDPTTLKVGARVPVGDDPHEVIASSDGATAYVSNYGYGSLHTLAVIDLLHARPLGSIDLGALHGPHGLTFVQGKVWFTAEAAKAIGRYDPATQQVDWIMGTGENRTHMLHVSPDAQHIVTSNVNSGTISLLEQEPVHAPGPPPGIRPPAGGNNSPSGPPPNAPRIDWNETVIRVGNGSEGFDVSPDRKEIWVANAADGTISVIDYPGRKVVDTLASDTRGANRLKLTPDGKLVLVSSGPELVILDAATRKIIKRIPIGHGSAGVLVQPDGARAYVSCGPDNYVAVIDLRKLEVIAHIDAGGEPDGLAWSVKP